MCRHSTFLKIYRFKKLVEISKKYHQLKAEGKEKEVEKLEEENDEFVKKLFSIK